MSRTRFGLLVGLAAVVVAAAAFLIGLQVLDDEGPDRPPRSTATDGGDAPATDEGDEPGDETTSTSEAAVVTAGELPSPSWVLVISSEGGEDRARSVAEEVAAAGHPSGFLRSDDYASLNPGFWVAYAGPYPEAADATEAAGAIEADGWPGAYLRCVGTADDCGGPPRGEDRADDDEDDDDD
jgi:hypothetical protein